MWQASPPGATAPAGRRTLNSIVEELLQPLLATARRIELDLARSRASIRARPDA